MTKLSYLTENFSTTLLILLSILVLLNTYSHVQCSITTAWMEERLFDRARCKANCLRLFNNPTEQEVFHNKWRNDKISDLDWSMCFEESREQCSSGCFTACDLLPNECLTHCAGSTIGCYIGCLLIQQTFEKRSGECPQKLRYSLYDLNNSSSNMQNDELNYDKHKSIKNCVNNCQSDSDCKNPLQICCKSDCHQQCTLPIYNELVPPLSIYLNSTVSSTNSNIIKLFWSDLYKDLTTPLNPIVFILQVRICTCQVFNENYSSKWQTLIMTHEFGANLEAFEPGRLYQFRIAAVSIHGTRGFGLSTKAYPIDPVKPKPPGPPRNVTDSMWRLYSSGKISLLLRWQPPIHSDLPVSEYLINWSIDHGYLQPDGRSLEALIQFTQTVSAERTECVLSNLKPVTSYKIQVKAVSHWYGFGSLESQPNTIFLSTQSIHPAFHQQNIEPVQTPIPARKVKSSAELSLQPNLPTCECGSTLQPLLLKRIFYDNKRLNAVLHINISIEEDSTMLIQWFPQVCIDSNDPSPTTITHTMILKPKDEKVVFENLYFNCRYSVRIRVYKGVFDETYLRMVTSVISTENRYFDSRDYYACFCTPSCLDVEVNHGEPPDDCPPPAPEPPSPPTQLKVVHMGNLNYLISWEQPMSSQGRKTRTVNKNTRLSLTNKLNRNSTKYRIIWAPRIQEPVDESMYNDEIGFIPIMDIQQTDVRVIDKDQTWIALKQLKPNTFYIVRVQTLIISHNGMERESNPVSLYFTTTRDQEMKRSLTLKSDQYKLKNSSSSHQVVTGINISLIHLSILFSFRSIYYL